MKKNIWNLHVIFCNDVNENAIYVEKKKIQNYLSMGCFFFSVGKLEKT